MSNNNDSKKTQIELEAIANRMSRMSKSLDYLYEAADSQGDHVAGILFSLCNEAFEAHEKLKSLAEKLADADEAEQDKIGVSEDDYEALCAMVKRRKVLSGAMPIEFEMNDKEFADLSVLAKEAGKGVNEFASGLIVERLERCLESAMTA
jgi:hypothetical protein